MRIAKPTWKEVKELEASVIWRCTQSLNAAITSCAKRSLDFFRSSIESSCRYLDDEALEDAITRTLTHAASDLQIMHPVVVLDAARLWSLDGEDLVEVDRVRLVIPQQGGWFPSWFDVVTRDGFDLWLAESTAHYTAALGAPDEYQRQLVRRVTYRMMHAMYNASDEKLDAFMKADLRDMFGEWMASKLE